MQIALHNGHPELLQRRDLPLEPPLRPVALLGVGGVGSPAGEHGGDEAIDLSCEHLERRDLPAGSSPQRVAEHRQRVRPGLLERPDERVYEGRVPAHPVRPVEDYPDRGSVRVVTGEQIFERRSLRSSRGGRRPSPAPAQAARSRAPRRATCRRRKRSRLAVFVTPPWRRYSRPRPGRPPVRWRAPRAPRRARPRRRGRAAGMSSSAHRRRSSSRPSGQALRPAEQPHQHDPRPRQYVVAGTYPTSSILAGFAHRTLGKPSRQTLRRPVRPPESPCPRWLAVGAAFGRLLVGHQLRSSSAAAAGTSSSNAATLPSASGERPAPESHLRRCMLMADG